MYGGGAGGDGYVAYQSHLEAMVVSAGFLSPGRPFRMHDFPFLMDAKCLYVPITSNMMGPGVTEEYLASIPPDDPATEIMYDLDHVGLLPFKRTAAAAAAAAAAAGGADGSGSGLSHGEFNARVGFVLTRDMGVDVIAGESLPPDFALIEGLGVIRRWDEYSRETHIEHTSYAYRLRDNLVLDSLGFGNGARFFNHSATPNVTAYTIRVEGVDRLIFFTNQVVLRGQRLTVSYGEDYVSSDIGWM